MTTASTCGRQDAHFMNVGSENMYKKLDFANEDFNRQCTLEKFCSMASPIITC